MTTDFGKYKPCLENIWRMDMKGLEGSIKNLASTDPRALFISAEAAWFNASITEIPAETDQALAQLQQTLKFASTIVDQHAKTASNIKKQKGLATPVQTPKTPQTPITEELSSEDMKKHEELENALKEEETKNELNDLINDQKFETDSPSLQEVDGKDELGSLLLYLSARSIVAEVLLYDSLLKFKIQKFIKGVYSFRKSWKIFEEMLKFIPTIPDNLPDNQQELKQQIICSANFGAGFFHFLVSVIPPQFLWLVEGVGFKGNRALGLEELKIAVTSNGYRSLAGAFCLVWVYVFFLEDYVQGEKILNEWIQKYPNASFLHYLAGSINRKQAKTSLSTENFEKALQTIAPNNKQFELYCEFEIGYNYYLQRNWPAALPKLKKFFDESPTPGFKAYTGFQIAMCYAMSFQQDKANELMKQLLPFVRKSFTYDEYAERKAKHFLENGFSNFDRKFMIAYLQHESQEYESVVDGLDTLQSLANTDLEKAQLSWLRGAALFGVKKYDEAIDPLEKAIGLKKKVEKSAFSFVLPYSHTILGEIYVIQKKYDKAADNFKKARSYSSYDFDALLLWRIKKGQDQVAVATK